MKDKLKKAKKPAKLLKSKKKLSDPIKKKKIQAMSVDDFMGSFMNEEETDTNEATLSEKKLLSKKKKTKTPEINGNDSDNESDIGEGTVSHKKQLDGLKKSDPEFYKYLAENDSELLNFDDSDDEDEENEKNEKVHKPPDSLEVASDESDYEPDEEVIRTRTGKSNKVTKAMIDQWQKELHSKKNFKTLKEVADAFHAAVISVSPDEDSTCVYKVEGATIFNSVIRMCVLDMLPAVQSALGIKQGSKIHPEKCKTWSKVKVALKSYFTDLTELSRVSSSSMLTVLLKHIHQMAPFIACFPQIAAKFLRRIIELWATNEDVVRVLAFLCALRFGNLRASLLKLALKVMHLTYVRTAKFVSPSTLPGINFMRQSLCEMFVLDNTTSYHMAFLYIRQLAIHLRNAITMKKKESYKTVYNWAYISSLHLWADLFGMSPKNSPLKSLIYPLVQIIIGTIKLIPSSQYYPLRFHCVRILINLSDKCGVFIPVLPFLLEVLRDFNFNKEHKKLSMKPMDFTCLLRCSKSQMKENAFRDALIENVHGLLMEYLAIECHRVSFPDMTVPCVIEMKHFLKTCKQANYTKKMKAVLDKLSENSKFIEAERKKLSLKLDDMAGIEAAEMGLKMKEPPFLKYYQSWKKIYTQQQARKVTNNEKVGDFKLPVLYKLEKKRNREDTKSVGPPELFPSDDEDSDIADILKEDPEPPKKKKKKEKMEVKKVVKAPENEEDSEDIDGEDIVEDSEDIDGEDIVEDLRYSDFK